MQAENETTHTKICLQTASQEAAQRAPMANQPKSTRRHQKTTENIDKEPSKKLKNSKKQKKHNPDAPKQSVPTGCNNMTMRTHILYKIYDKQLWRLTKNTSKARLTLARYIKP